MLIDVNLPENIQVDKSKLKQSSIAERINNAIIHSRTNDQSYINRGFPNILDKSKSGETGYFPKVSTNEENYGLLYNKPETESEKNMHELWMAKRRQEAFDWKSQQQLNMVFDRLAVHKSRLETDALRR